MKRNDHILRWAGRRRSQVTRMERWVDQRDPNYRRSDHNVREMNNDNSNINNTSRRHPVHHTYRRSSSGSIERQLHRHTAPESQVGKQQRIPPTSNFHHPNDMLKSHHVERRKEHDERRFSYGDNGEDRRQRQHITSNRNGATHDDKGGRHFSTSPHRSYRDERKHKNHPFHRRSSITVASDPLPRSAEHHRHKLGSRWSKPSAIVRKNDASHQMHGSIPVEIISTNNSSSSYSRYDNGNDLSDESPSVEYSPNVENESSSVCCFVSTTSKSLSKPHDANPQEDFSLSPKNYHVTQNSVLPTTETRNNVASNRATYQNELCLKPPMIPSSQSEESHGMEITSEVHVQKRSTSIDNSIRSERHNATTKQVLTTDDMEKLQTPKLCDEDGESPCDASKFAVGTRVAIYWDSEGKYFTGTVTKFRPTRKKPYHVKYEDGDREWINFTNERYHIIEECKGSSSFVAKQCVDVTSTTVKMDALGSKRNGSCEQIDWVAAGMIKNDSDSDTDDEEVTQWAVRMFGIHPSAAKSFNSQSVREKSVQPPTMTKYHEDKYFSENYDIPMSISEKVKLGRRNRSNSFTEPEAVPAKKPTKKLITLKSKAAMDAEIEAEAKLRKQQARPLTAAEIRSILSDDHMDTVSTSWVRRSVRQPSKSSLTAPRVKELLEKLVCNDSDMIVLKMKKYCSDLDTPSIVIDAVLDALEDNTNCEALYIQVCLCANSKSTSLHFKLTICTSSICLRISMKE